MSILRPSLVTARTLGRNLGIWPFLFPVVWALIIRGQEPPLLIRQDAGFFWASQQSMLLLGIGLLPLAWRLTQGSEAMSWSLHVARSNGLPVLCTWLGLVIYGGIALLSAVLASCAIDILTVYRISGTADLTRALGALARSLSFLLFITSLAPGLALWRGSTTTVVFAWLCVLGLALLALGPSEISAATTGTSDLLSGMVSGVLATLGGLSVSMALTHHHLRH